VTLTSALTEKEVELLGGRELPPGWNDVPASKYAFVARRHGAIPVYFKMFYPRSKVEWIKSLVRGSRCRRAVDATSLLTRSGFNTPSTLQSGRIKNGKNKGLEFFVSESVPAAGFADYVYEHWARPVELERLQLKREMLRDLGSVIGRLHNQGIVHGDLRPNNVLVLERGQKKDYYFIDNERTRVSKKIALKKRIKNLVQIGMLFSSVLSRTDRVRFFKAYCFENDMSLTDSWPLALEVYRVTNGRLAGRDGF